MPLANEFQRKMQAQATELNEKAKGPGPKGHPEDTLIVMNILVDDETEVEEVIPYANSRRDPRHPDAGTSMDFSRLDNHIFEHSWNTKDYFEVRWDGRPHRIYPGKTRHFPRYLAEHFAKAMIDFILTKREDKEKLTGLMRNRLERKKLYDQIIIGVASHYNGDGFEDAPEGLRVEHQVGQMNVQAFNVGEVPNVAMGYGLTDKPPEKVEDTPVTSGGDKPAGVPWTVETLTQARTRPELMREAKQAGLEVTPDMTKDQLATAILNF